ncbi:MAG: FIST C-terminal domain-containing protein [Candidatus Omnitrophica bacterium]|nr:FIST C-terminal domain-containing protein [Candidatus Omnitrophota bacterium]
MEEKFAIALSERNDEEAIREVSLKIKSIFPKTLKAFFVFFTPHYQPAVLLKNIALTLKPQAILGVGAPYLTFEDKIIEKGVVGCCLNKDELNLRGFFSKSSEQEDIETAMRKTIKDFPREKQFLLSFIPARFSPSDCLRSFSLTLGKTPSIIGAGFLREHTVKNFKFFNETVDEGLLSVIGSGIEITSLELGGFLPVGKPFKLTRVKANRGLIMEIDDKPAITIYKHYLEEKFDTFIRNRLFTLYPLGVWDDNRLRLVYILDYLDDGSCTYIGEAKENAQAQIMLFNPPSLFSSIKKDLARGRAGNKNEGLAFIVNSTMRKKILKDYAYEEARLIKKQLGEKMKVIGIYSDYAVFTDNTHRTNIEAGNPIITFWE